MITPLSAYEINKLTLRLNVLKNLKNKLKKQLYWEPDSLHRGLRDEEVFTYIKMCEIDAEIEEISKVLALKTS